MDNDDTTLPLFEIVAAQGWTLVELSRRARLSISTIAKVKSGERGLGEDSIKGFRRALPGFSEVELFGTALIPEDEEIAA